MLYSTQSTCITCSVNQDMLVIILWYSYPQGAVGSTGPLGPTGPPGPSVSSHIMFANVYYLTLFAWCM